MFQPTLAPSLTHVHRRHPRVQLKVPVRLCRLGPLGQLTEATETLDVSRGGMLFSHRVPAGSRR